MKKTIEIKNKIIVIFRGDYVIDEKVGYNTFEEAYEAVKNRYTDENIVGWDTEEWNETFDFEEAKGKFEAYDYVEFCDGDEITTTERFLDEILSEIL